MPDVGPALPNPGLSIRLDADLAAVERSRLWVLDSLAPHDIAGRVINRIEVILEELITNVVRHSVGATLLTVAVCCDDEKVTLIIEDDGPEFDPFAVAPPKPFTSLANAEIGGLGVSMIKKLSTAVRYDRTGSASSARNRVCTEIAR